MEESNLTGLGAGPYHSGHGRGPDRNGSPGSSVFDHALRAAIRDFFSVPATVFFHQSAMPEKLFLIDGYSYIYQSFYALPGLTSPDGSPTGAAFGVARLLEMIGRKKPDYAVFVLDTKAPTFRHKEFREYKATRKPMPPELAAQIPLIERIVETYGLKKVAVPGFEADDVIGTIAAMAASRGIETLIVSRDKDLKQLLGDLVRIYDFKSDTFYDAASLKAETGLDPGLFPDFIGLAGDSSDNIPGVKGVGEKTALKLLSDHGSLEEVLSNWEKIKGKMGQKIRDGAESARLSRRLATIRTDVPLGMGLEDMAAPARPGPALGDLYRQAGFKSLVAAVETGSTTEGADYGAVETAGAFKALISDLSAADAWAFDLETTSLDPISAEIAGISVCTRGGSARYVPLLAPERSRCLDRSLVMKGLAPLLADPRKRKVGQNLKFDVSVLKARGIEVSGLYFDTLVAAYLLNPGERDLNLDSLAQKHLGIRTVPISDLIGSGKEQISFDLVPLDKAAPYSCEDADMAFRLRGLFEPALKEHGLWKLFSEVEMPLVEVLAGMETAGIALDASVLERLGGEVETEAAGLEERIYAAAGERFNINSPAQLRPILFEKLKLPGLRKTKTGSSTAVDVLEELAHLHPLPALMLEYRQLAKLKSTYIDVLPQMKHPGTGRIHAKFNQAVTATGRLSSSDPNLQNIPVRTETGRKIREAFVAGGPGMELLTADYSQVELRILAHMSGDPAMISAFEADADIHSEVASQIFGVHPSLVDSEMRRKAKAVNFGLIYGQTPYGLSRFIGISQPEARKFIDAYFGRFPSVKDFFERIVKEAEETRSVRTILGRIRAIPDITAANKARRAAAERTAVNTVIQGSAADLMKVAMVNLHRRLLVEKLPARILVQIHDELLLETEKESSDAVESAVVAEMSRAMNLRVPLKVDTARGSNWRLA